MYSIYTLWQDLSNKKNYFKSNSSLIDFPFNRDIFSYSRRGKGFPTFSIKLNGDKSELIGGELVKLKTRNRYSISPFKSSIPTGKVKVKTIVGDPRKSRMRREMEKTGDDVFSLEDRFLKSDFV